MRRLIRPALFWVARIGLVFSVAAVVVSQWFSLTLSISEPSGQCTIASSGVAFVSRGRAMPINLWCDVVPNDFNSVFSTILNSSPTWPSDVAGIRWFDIDAGRSWFRGVAIPHWPIVTTSALFYAVLKWVYREREVVRNVKTGQPK